MTFADLNPDNYDGIDVGVLEDDGVIRWDNDRTAFVEFKRGAPYMAWDSIGLLR